MIKAVIFDCFGVLAREGFFPFLEEYFTPDSNDKQEAIDTMRRMGAGLLGHDECIAELARLANISYAEMETKLTDNPADEKLFAYIETDLKPHYKVAMLSNAGADRTIELFGERRAALFDDVVLSYQVGMTKPDPEIYTLAVTRLGIMPEEAVFIDDVERYCNAAEQIGMRALWHQDSAETIARLKELLSA